MLFLNREELSLNRIESQRLPNTREAATMNRQRAKIFQRLAVLGCRITFVTGEPVAGIKLVHLEHVCVARCLRDDRRSGNTGGERIAADDAALRCLAVWNLPRVDENEI